MKRVDSFGLLGLADDTYKTLHSFNIVQNKFADFRGVSWLQPEPAIIAVEEYIKQLVGYTNRLEGIMPILANRPPVIADVESDFCQALGTYLCDLLNSMNGYLYFLRVHQTTIPRFVLARAWRRWKALREFKKYEKIRLKSGLTLKYCYSLYNIAQ